MTEPGFVAPHSQPAEESVIGNLIRDPDKMEGILAERIEGRHFYRDTHRVLFELMVERLFADERWDPITLGEILASKLGNDEFFNRVQELAANASPRGLLDHAKIVRRMFDMRELLTLSNEIKGAVLAEQDLPDQIAGMASQKALEIATGALPAHEIISYGDVGRAFVKRQRMLIAAREQGIEIGAYFGIGAMDDYMMGLKPGELVFSAGEPGVGKSICWWMAGKSYALRQMPKPEEDRRAAMILSLEMGQEPSEDRLATNLSGIDGGKMRQGLLTPAELDDIRRKWSAEKDLPLQFNYTSTLRISQMRALVSEAIRRHKVNVVIIDHFRHFELDKPAFNTNQEDEEKVKFLKNGLAKDLGVAVVCIAHTTKTIDTPDGRPTLAHLRGSGQISAFADFVNFVYRPYMHASEEAREKGDVHPFDAELIYAKSRFGVGGPAPFRMNPSAMTIY